MVAGGRAVKLANDRKSTYVTSIILALWTMEVFLGIGQIWFYTVEHFIAWTLIYLMIKTQMEGEQIHHEERKKCKYIRD